MALVLGLDAAWTERGSSGVALLRVLGGKRKMLAAAPSYSGFIALASGTSPGWRRPLPGAPNAEELLRTASTLAGGETVDLVAIDMPISRQPIQGRRRADQAVSQSFGALGAAVHSPSSNRPDAAVTAAVKAFEVAGFPIRTNTTQLPGMFEVYPLAALTQLLGAPKRPAYKASKTARYGWSGPRAARIDKLLHNWQIIVAALQGEVGELPISFPDCARSFAELKPYEDALDAVVCAWVGACIVDGTAVPYPSDDLDSAVWIPQHSGRGIGGSMR